MSAIKDLERKVQSLRSQLADAEKKLNDAKLEVVGVRVGDIVKSTGTYHQAGKLFRVCEIDMVDSGKPWVSGNPQRKNGTYGTAKRGLYSYWEKA